MPGNPAMEWLKPGHRKKSRLKERRDPIVLPAPAHIDMVIAKAPAMFGNMIRAAIKTGPRLDELAKAERSHFDRSRQQLTVIGKRNKRRVIDLVDGGEDFGFDLLNSLPPRSRSGPCSGTARRRASAGSEIRPPAPTGKCRPTSGA
jgi:integrase/recombinase XerD